MRPWSHPLSMIDMTLCDSGTSSDKLDMSEASEPLHKTVHKVGFTKSSKPE